MSGSPPLRERLAEHDEEGHLSLGVGAGAAALGWALVPVLGLVAVGCGYRLVSRDQYRLPGVFIGVLGGLVLVDLLVQFATVI